MIYTRQQLEEFEDQQLAPYAIRSKIRVVENIPKKKLISAHAFNVIATAFCILWLLGALNTKHRSSSFTKATITAHVSPTRLRLPPLVDPLHARLAQTRI